MKHYSESPNVTNIYKYLIRDQSQKAYLNKYNNLKMSILDKAKIGNSVQVNLELSRDRLDKEIIDAINISAVGIINDFRITDGKGIGVVLQLSNGKEQWFFEDEIDFLDENGNVIKKIEDKKEKNSIIFNFFSGLRYEKKNNFKDLLNPINFFLWIIVSFKDII